jgi:hypothetical protein
MQAISSATLTTATTPVGSTSQIAFLQKQLKDLTQKVKDLATNSSLDAKAKQREAQLLQTQIAAVQAQIEAIRDQQHRAQMDKTFLSAMKNMIKPQDSTKTRTVVTTNLVDAYA